MSHGGRCSCARSWTHPRDWRPVRDKKGFRNRRLLSHEVPAAGGTTDPRGRISSATIRMIIPHRLRNQGTQMWEGRAGNLVLQGLEHRNWLERNKMAIKFLSTGGRWGSGSTRKNGFGSFWAPVGNSVTASERLIGWYKIFLDRFSVSYCLLFTWSSQNRVFCVKICLCSCLKSGDGFDCVIWNLVQVNLCPPFQLYLHPVGRSKFKKAARPLE